jgi:hypothetical protein
MPVARPRGARSAHRGRELWLWIAIPSFGIALTFAPPAAAVSAAAEPSADYRSAFRLDSRLIVWIVAQVYLMDAYERAARGPGLHSGLP